MANLSPGLYADLGGVNSGLNVAGAAQIKGAPGRLVRIVVLVATTGTATFNDCATTGAATAANAVLNIPTGATVGSIFYLNWPCLAGIVCSAAGGGTFCVAFS